jgi:hypothetical protein
MLDDQPPELSRFGFEAIAIFGMMGGRMDFNQFGSICEVMDLEDPLMLLSLLNAIVNKVPRL